jgi:adenosylmethionine-8-amino-7-oxononanoate aminotransferase
MFASEGWPVAPDFLLLSKAITSGYLPLAVTLASPRVIDAFNAHDVALTDHETSSGNPAVCAAALATLDVIEADGLVANAARMGPVLAEQLATLNHPALEIHRQGEGLRQCLSVIGQGGERWDRPRMRKLEARCRKEGLLVSTLASGVLAIRPPLILQPSDAGEIARRLGNALHELKA